VYPGAPSMIVRLSKAKAQTWASQANHAPGGLPSISAFLAQDPQANHTLPAFSWRPARLQAQLRQALLITHWAWVGVGSVATRVPQLSNTPPVPSVQLYSRPRVGIKQLY